MATNNENSGAKGKLWVRVMCGVLAGIMVLGAVMMLIQVIVA